MPVPSYRPPPADAPSRRGVPRRLFIGAAAAVTAALLLGLGAASLFGDRFARAGDPAGQWRSPTETVAPTQPSPVPTTPPAAAVTLSATGDIVLGDEGRLPADDGAGFFAQVVDALAADLVMGNLEQPLTEDTGHEKCPEEATACHAFRAPPHYAAHLRDGGFDLMNLANNHGNDFGPAGRENTRAALADHGIAHTGEREEITVVSAAGVEVAVVGFSPYAWTNDLNDHGQASAVVARAADQADLVVVQVHMGAEGADATRVSPGPEEYYGEQRGDPMAFARAVVDAGADLVVGHGPHVLRGLEFYQGRLIAYSLGNFAGGGGTLNAAGPLGLGAVLRVSLHADGGFAAGQLVSTHMYDAGLPRPDPEQRGLELVRDVTALDFPETGAQLGPDGEITPPSVG
ncbi:CapA family protein [Natronosporangium hydrolyticum]|uniref:CapA family protein n=1 Tax=Natronosporangium hydrolyticum TaxID=2811111 RepID=A0A895YAW1_9ACTN|nr:CapA family protein [Natronosporangium hydrolyticum]QSB14541.1 CapA family protein [Natronosporangium hydrolyticum]